MEKKRVRAATSEEQKIVIESKTHNNTRIIACAGAGKTKTMVERVLFMIENMYCNPDEFVIVTFTKNAAKELIKRLNDGIDSLFMNIVDKRLDAGGDSRTNYAELLKFKYDQLGTFHALARRTLNQFPNYLNDKLGCVFNIDELQYHFLNLLKDNKELLKNKHIFVDEFQDLNQVQYDIVKELGSRSLSLTVVGDDDQNIYSFRKSSVKFMYDFETDFKDVKTYFLSTNYRCSPTIVDLANAVLQSAKQSTTGDNALSFKPPIKSGVEEFSMGDVEYPKPILINSSIVYESIKIICNQIKTLIDGGVKGKNICILSRNNYILFDVQTKLIQKGIKTLFYSGEDDYSKNHSKKLIENSVVLSSIHSSKGLEWDYVFLLGLHGKYFPSHLEKDLLSEYRLMYVAVTRARNYLTVCNSSDEPSIFITNLDYKRYFKVVGKQMSLTYKLSEAKKTDVFWEGVTNRIRMLDGNDYIQLKQTVIKNKYLEMLLNPVPPATIYDVDNKEFPYYSFIAENQIESEFGQYLDLLARRMVAEQSNYNPELFKDESVESCLEGKVKNIPKEFTAKIKKCYEIYQNPKKKSLEIIDSIFYLSCCSSIMRGKQYVLYIAITYQDLMKYNEMYKQMESQIKRLLTLGDKQVTSSTHVKFAPLNSVRGMRGIIDLLIDDSIIDFKNTLYDTKTCRIEYFIQVLTYASLYFLSTGKKINKVGIYNIIADCIFFVDISDWHYEQELINHLLK